MTITRHIATVLLSVLCFISGLQTVAAQDKAAAGTVVDESGVPVIGATVQVQGTNDWTITDNDGKFSLNLQKDGTRRTPAQIPQAHREQAVRHSYFCLIWTGHHPAQESRHRH